MHVVYGNRYIRRLESLVLLTSHEIFSLRHSCIHLRNVRAINDNTDDHLELYESQHNVQVIYISLSFLSYFLYCMHAVNGSHLNVQ